MIFILKCFLLLVLTVFIRNIVCWIIAKMAKNYFFYDGYSKHLLYEKILKYKSVICVYSFGIFIFILALINGYSIVRAGIYMSIAIMIIIIYRKVREESIKKQILQDLLNVSECLRVQLSSQISLSIALRNLTELCKNKEFSELLKGIYMEYELDKFTITNSGNELESRFNYPEIKLFISALKQQSQHTSAIELFDNLIDILREEYIEFLEDATKSKMAIMTMGVFIIVINVAAIGIYPVVIEVFSAMDMMFS